jgi:SAM-dependent methyltransferase
LIDYIKNNIQSNTRIRLLDVGCGNGGFVKSLIEANRDFDYFVTDMSSEMVLLAKQNLVNHDYDVKLFVADGFNLPIREQIEFDIIHIDSVFHHLIDKTQTRSTGLIKQMAQLLVSRLSCHGMLIVDEWYFLSYVIPSFVSFLIFYGLKLINHLKLDLAFIGEIQPGLEVNFLLPEKLLKILSDYGSASLLKRSKVEFPLAYRFFLLKEKGRITCILRKTSAGS